MPIPFAAAAVGLGRAALSFAGRAVASIGTRVAARSAMHLVKRGALKLLGRSQYMKNARAWRQSSPLEKMWAIESAYNTANALKAQIDSNLPSFVHTIAVAVRGGPEADLRRMWYLCLAAAFGRWRNRAKTFQQKTIEATWDITSKACSVTIGYSCSGLEDQLTKQKSRSELTPYETSGLGLLQRGPDQVTVGGNWPGFMWTNAQLYASQPAIFSSANTAMMIGGLFQYGMAAPVLLFQQIKQVIQLQSVHFNVNTTGKAPKWSYLPTTCSTYPQPIQIFKASGRSPDSMYEVPKADGISLVLPWRRILPSGSTEDFGSAQSPYGKLPVLPDDGRVITTGEKLDANIQHRGPVLDGVGRTNPIALVAQVLQNPCYLANSPPCSLFPLGSSGVYAYQPGSDTETLPLNGAQISQVTQPLSETRSWTQDILNAVVSAFNYLRGRDGYGAPPEQVPNLRG